MAEPTLIHTNLTKFNIQILKKAIAVADGLLPPVKKRNAFANLAFFDWFGGDGLIALHTSNNDGSVFIATTFRTYENTNLFEPFSVELHLLHAFLKQQHDVCFLDTSEAGFAIFRVGDSVLRLPKITKLKIPVFEPKHYASRVAVFAECPTFLKDLQTVAPFQGGALQPHVNGVYFEVKNQKLKMTATDSHTLATVSRRLSREHAESAGIIPADAIKALLELSSNSNHFIPNLLQFGNDQKKFNPVCNFYFSLGETSSIFGKCVDYNYSNYEHVIPKECWHEFEFHRDVVAKELACFNSSKDRMVLVLKPRSSELACTQHNHALNSKLHKVLSTSSNQIRANFQRPISDLEIGVDFVKLRNVLRATKEKKLILRLTDPLAPILLTDLKADLRIVIMPMRV